MKEQYMTKQDKKAHYKARKQRRVARGKGWQ